MQKRTEEALKIIEDSLLNGDMGGSGFLPSERELCRRLSIGRGALHAVFDELIRRKRVCHVPGKGMKLLFSERESLVLRKYILVMPATGTGVRNGEIANILCGAASSAAHFNAEYEGHTMLPVIKDFVSRYELEDFIVVADSGLMNNDNVSEMESLG